MLITLKWAWNSHCFRVSTSSHKAQGTRHKAQKSTQLGYPNTSTINPLPHLWLHTKAPWVDDCLLTTKGSMEIWQLNHWQTYENHMISEKNVLLLASSFSTTSRVSSFFISCRTWGSTTGSKSVIEYRPTVQRCFKTGSCRNRWNQISSTWQLNRLP